MKKLLIVSMLLLASSLSAQTIRFVVKNPRDPISADAQDAYNNIFTKLELSYDTVDKANTTRNTKNTTLTAQGIVQGKFFELSEPNDIVLITNIKLTGSYNNNPRWTWPSETPKNIRELDTKNSQKVNINIAWSNNPPAEYISTIELTDINEKSTVIEGKKEPTPPVQPVPQPVQPKPDINAKDRDGSTLLMRKINAHEKIVEVKQLIEQGADVNAKDKTGMTVLMYAANAGNKEAAQLLIEKGADVNAKDNLGTTALLHAIQRSFCLDMVKLLIEKGADVNAKDAFGTTALLRTIQRSSSLDMVKLLIEKGADSNAKDNSGETALMHAANRGDKGTVQLLIEKGADVNVKDNKGKTALDRISPPEYNQWKVYIEIRELLKNEQNKGLRK